MKTCRQPRLPKIELHHFSRPLPWVVSLTVLLLITSALRAANYTVQMTGGLVFSPNQLSINQGDSVTWTNTALFAHTSTSGNAPNTNGLWSSGSVNAASSFTVTFNDFAGGTYPYFCSFHWPEGMTGTLTITNAIVSPVVLSGASWKTNQFQFTLNGPIGQSYVVETSSNFTTWSALNTNLATSTNFILTDPAASNQLGFYRVRQAP